MVTTGLSALVAIRLVAGRLLRDVRSVFPEGHPIPLDVWDRRHTWIVRLVWLHALGLIAAGVLVLPDHAEAELHGVIVAALGIAAGRPQINRRLRAVLATVGLLLSSASLVQASGGVVEMHFHFFIALAVVAFYQDWLVYLLAVTFVLVEHGITGVLYPTSVFNHAAAIEHPWEWAAVHAVFIAAASVANLLGWRAIEHQALHDPLTRLPNRALFRSRAERSHRRARWTGGALAIIFIDLDRFKPVNDTWGHHIGDQVLVAVADRLGRTVRASDTVARLGGDEFAVLLTDISDAAEALAAAQRLVEALREPFQVRELGVTLHGSLGIALHLSTEPADDTDALLRDADVAMYSAKHRGGDRAIVFEASMRASAAERLELEGDLRHALAQNQLTVHYQPTVDLATGKIVGSEALARWDHHTRGLVPPNTFIPLAEEAGLIVPIGRWVLEEACSQAQAWNDQFPDRPPLAMSVNVSPIQLRREEFVHEVADVLSATGMSPELLTLEITESALMEDSDASMYALQQLKTLGVRLAIDDFGTGYSSLNYLQRMPIDILKIDRSFVHHLERGGDDLAFARAIVDLARTLSLRTVAEGIEVEAQATCLDELGCDLGQGYLYARPVPAHDMTAMLAGSPWIRAAS